MESTQLKSQSYTLADGFKQVIDKFREVSSEFPGKWIIGRVIEHRVPTVAGATPEYNKQ